MDGFRILEEFESTEVNGWVRVLIHEASGAEIIFIKNDDTNKVFGVTLKTPVTDSTGVAHILEHMVLNGSKKYPLKEPFVDLLKGSLYTFLNAFTYPDRTVYPVASENLVDFKNLVGVYLDAVFAPLLRPEVFAQEGWHYHKEDENWIFKGVVYNEMKGAYSSVDSVQAQMIQERLLPDTMYGFESGGNPRDIVNLTHEQLKAFHAKYYVPENAVFYFYGDIGMEEGLALLDGYVGEFQFSEEDVTELPDPSQSQESIDMQVQADYVREFVKMGRQESWNEPRVVQEKFVASEGDTRAWVTLNWKLPLMQTYDDYLEWELIQYLLVGTPGSYVRKALVDSGWGTDLTGWGWDASLAEAVFSTGLKEMSLERNQDLEQMILQVMSDVVEKGIDRDFLEAGLNSLEFSIRENNTGGYPRGLDLMVRLIPMWIYDRDWRSLVAYEPSLFELKRDVSALSARLVARIKRDLLENVHRMRLEMIPDETFEKKLLDDEAARLAERVSMWSEADGKQAQQLFEQVQVFQEKVDTPEEIVLLPSLTRADLKKEVLLIPSEVVGFDGVEYLVQRMHTYGIGYVDVVLDFSHIDEQALLYLPLLVRCWTELGTDTYDYVAWQRMVDGALGGLDGRVVSRVGVDGSLVCKIVFRLKALHDRKDLLARILKLLLFDVSFDNKERVRQMLMEEIAGFESQLISAGHTVVGARVMAHLHPVGVLNERLSGIEQLEFLRDVLRDYDAKWEGFVGMLEGVRENLLRKENVLVSISADEGELEAWRDVLHTIFSTVQIQTDTLSESADGKDSAWQLDVLEGNEALQLPSQVNFVGWGGILENYDARGSVAMHILGLSYLWDRVRAKGGAYGARGVYDMVTNTVVMSSYRDPQVEQTLGVYREAGTFLEELALSTIDVDRAVIGLIGQMDRPMLADARAMAALSWHLTGATREWRQARRDEILDVALYDLQLMGKLLSKVTDEVIVVMGPVGVEKRVGGDQVKIKKML